MNITRFGHIARLICFDDLQLTSSIVHQLLVTLEDFNGNVRQATYSSFGVAREDQGYELEFLGTYDGNAGNILYMI